MGLPPKPAAFSGKGRCAKSGRLVESLPALLEPYLQLWSRHCVQHVAVFQPAAARLVDALFDEADLLGAVGVGVDRDLHADLSGAKEMHVV